MNAFKSVTDNCPGLDIGHWAYILLLIETMVNAFKSVTDKSQLGYRTLA